MRFLSYRQGGRPGLAVLDVGAWRGATEGEGAYARLEDLVHAPDRLRRQADALAACSPIDLASVEVQPPLSTPSKIVCVGLNYRDHASEVKIDPAAYPTLFTRFPETLVGAEAPLVRPVGCDQFDYEGEIAAVIGRGGRRIPKAQALEHVAGWSLFNDASARDFQFRTPQWTAGKNFDGTGAFGPEFVTADEVADGARGLTLRTRLNGQVVQEASTDDMIFDVATLVAVISEITTLRPGDVIVTGTPAGVGMAREPQLFMAGGDVVEIEATGLGVLRNRVVDEAAG